MQMHELMDREDPRCLYCQSECDVHIDGFGAGLVSHDVDILNCRMCKEVFEIHSITKVNGENEIIGFTFSCKNLVVVNNYKEGFAIGDKGFFYAKWGPNNVYNYIQAFDVDFSNKKKLYKKLKTYLVFS